jgi:hypothetical protein
LYPALIPNRVTDDSVLKIRIRQHVVPQQQHQHLPHAVAQQQSLARRWSNQFDPNTAWMEMLIHHEQQQQQNRSLDRKQRNVANVAAAAVN